MQNVCGLVSIALLLFTSVARADRSTSVSQIFYNGGGGNLTSDVTVENISNVPQTVCTIGGIYDRDVPTYATNTTSPVCPYQFEAISGDVTMTAKKNPVCGTLKPGSHVDVHVGPDAVTPACHVLGGIVRLTITVQGNSGSVIASGFVSLGGSLSFFNINNGHPF